MGGHGRIEKRFSYAAYTGTYHVFFRSKKREPHTRCRGFYKQTGGIGSDVGNIPKNRIGDQSRKKQGPDRRGKSKTRTGIKLLPEQLPGAVVHREIHT